MDHMTGREGNRAELMLESENLSETTKNTESMLQDHSPARINPNKQQPGRRVRMCSESEVGSQVGRRDHTKHQEGLAHADEGNGAPFRGRSQSAPAALLAAKQYGRQLRRMSDEFDTWLDRGEPKRGSSSPAAQQQQASRGWFSFLWSSKEAEGRE